MNCYYLRHDKFRDDMINSCMQWKTKFLNYFLHMPKQLQILPITPPVKIAKLCYDDNAPELLKKNHISLKHKKDMGICRYEV